MNPEGRPLIFISHASEDAEATRTLQADLDDRFIGSVRFFNTSSRESLKAGEHWLESIMTRLRESAIVLPILSPAALRNPWVNFETGGAWINGATVIPCCGGQVRKSVLPPPYNQLQSIDLDDVADLELLVARIADDIGLRARTDGLAELAQRMTSVFAHGSSEVATGHGLKLSNRIDRSLSIEWRYRRAEHDTTRWAATYKSAREFEVTDPTLGSLLVSFAPSVEAVPFSLDRAPVVTSKELNRSSTGTIRLAEPHRRTGSGFAFRIHFDPPLREGDTARIEFEIDFPEYKLGVKEDFVMAQLDAGHGTTIRDFDFNSLTINRPIDVFGYRAVLPVDLGASPLDPTVTRHSSPFPDEEAFLGANPAVYSVTQEDRDGEPCWVLQLLRENPPYQATYKLRWRLPGRAAVTRSTAGAPARQTRNSGG